MARYLFLYDGFNLYHSLKDVPAYNKYKWLDLYALSRLFVTKKDTIIDVYYFSAYAAWLPEPMKRHKVFVRDAFLDRYDRAVLVTVDSDLVPAIELVKKTFPGKEIYLLTPIRRNSFALRQVCDFRMKIKEKHLENCQFPDTIALEDGKELKRPLKWN